MTISAALRFRFVLIIPFDTGWNTTAVIGNGDGIIGMYRDVNFSTVTCE